MLEGRLAALCQQLAECVVTAPGMATKQMIAHMEQLLPRLAPRAEKRRTSMVFHLFGMIS